MKSFTFSFTMMIAALPLVVSTLGLTNSLFYSSQDLVDSLNGLMVNGESSFEGPDSLFEDVDSLPSVSSDMVQDYLDSQENRIQELWENVEPEITSYMHALHSSL